ncbi:MAG: RNA degradosome polyphosphate kinase [Lachnospiraceae bacterium]|nr:RNA degradosome polyphosphate kinase [Lachnospiraceae bacterium]
MEKTDFRNTEYYYNRELSWMSFNNRVLSEARDKSIPLFERMKFLSISASNLDEFFMIRVASLKDMVNAGYKGKDISGMTPSRQLKALNAATHELVAMQYSTFNRSLLPLMRSNGIHLVEKHEDLTREQAEFVDSYFEEYVYPVLTPMAVDSSRPFPLIHNKSLNIGILLCKLPKLAKRKEKEKKKAEKEEIEFATVRVPSVLPRIVEIPSEEGRTEIILLEEVIERNLNKLFLNCEIICAHPFRVMRNADLTIEEDEADDLLKEIEKQIKKRQWGEAIRLEVEGEVDERLLGILKKELSIHGDDIYRINGPLDMTFLMKLYAMEGFDHLKAEKHVPAPVKGLEHDADIFAAIREHDILLHHPYQTFSPVVELIQKAAKDKDVLAIKQTLYRVSGNSPIIAALAEAAENKKQVSVLVELKARFDEENNIVWARKLEKAGCHVIYGLVGLKTHSKITLIVRKEEDGIRRYVHLGTGNYNDATAKQYTDMGLMTCSEPVGEDATAVFNMLSGYSEPRLWNKLSVAPIWLKDTFLKLIHRERDHAMIGRSARIIAKMNALCDPDIIKALYEASSAGVKIDLIIRGICCLRVGIKGVSENIHVRSIVGNFLEHSRIFYFENGGNNEIYMGSADWMPRNLERRVEILFPVEDKALKEKVYQILLIQLKDNVKAHILKPDDTYARVDRRGKERCNSQEYFALQAKEDARDKMSVTSSRVFIPERHLEDEDGQKTGQKEMEND